MTILGAFLSFGRSYLFSYAGRCECVCVCEFSVGGCFVYPCVHLCVRV